MKSKISNIRDGVATRLREARELLGLKQAELATLTAISRSTQIAYEKGTTEPTTGYLQAAQRAGLDIDAVLFGPRDRKSTRLNSSHLVISYAVFCLKKKKNNLPPQSSSNDLRT